MTHGAKRMDCNFEGCTNQAQKAGVCITHDVEVKQVVLRGVTISMQSKQLLTVLLLGGRSNVEVDKCTTAIFTDRMFRTDMVTVWAPPR